MLDQRKSESKAEECIFFHLIGINVGAEQAPVICNAGKQRSKFIEALCLHIRGCTKVISVKT